MKKFLTVPALVLALLATPITSYAAEYSSDGTANCLVTAEISSTYSVSVPANIALSESDSVPGKFEGTYQVGAKGNIAGNKVVTVSPSANTLEMVGETTSTTATATVTQDVTQFVLKSPSTGQMLIKLNEYAYTEGSISVNLSDSDSYEGTLVFNFSMSDKQ